MPDAELVQAAAESRLRDPDELAGQARRMLRDGRTRRMAIEFGCQWLHVRDFDELDEKSARHFPTFAGLRGTADHVDAGAHDDVIAVEDVNSTSPLAAVMEVSASAPRR